MDRPTLSPLLNVRYGLHAIEFYRSAFGAEELFRLGESGSIVARLKIGKSEFWLTDESAEQGNFSPESLGGSTVRMILVVDDPDMIFTRAIRAGATIVSPLEDQPYGWRVGRLADPFGHHWEIGKPLHEH